MKTGRLGDGETRRGRPRMSLLPQPAHMSGAEAKLILKDQVFKDALAAGWLRECSRKPGGGSVYFATADVMDVSLRIAGGEYPVEDAETRRRGDAEKGSGSHGLIVSQSPRLHERRSA